ncbi:outer membrane beta-barrel protein [Sphingobacterium rhinopitheci]|uniref:outer membrane beta-barrel protein n=1 Tax=Sphingobacterium rhinopitheci TaxID=2781960 RepID=UPI001F5206FD|nr:TonB-dependent receptor [Sphingobacterium rhinopitheci]MCI0921253.1 TonB-dependent receptor [Sphingobacterium rhinopitheci]
MQKAYIIFLTILCQLICVELYAQSTIVGYLQDSLGAPIKSVNVRLIANTDTSSVFTNADGEYTFKEVKGNHILLVYSMLGYRTASSSHYLIEGQKELKVPSITLKSFSTILPSALVVRVLPMVINGDTVQFNFGAFDFTKRSLLEEALKGLPGFQVYRDGSVTYNGRQIKRVRVDNKDFFGGDLITATRNLPADFIKNIQLLNASTVKNGETGILMEDEEKILNINLKEDKKKIYFGQLTAGAGTNDRYLGSFGLNKFNKGQEISIIGSFNNTNANLFSLGTAFGGDRSKSAMELGNLSDPIDGLNDIGSIGITISDQLSKVIYANVSYNYLYQNNITDGNSQLTSSYIGNTIFRKEEYILNTLDRNHKLRFGFDMNFKNKDLFRIDGNLALNHQISGQNKDLSLNSFNSISEGNYQDSTRKNNPNGDLDLFYSKFFNKKGRKLIGNLTLSAKNNNRSDFVKEQYLEYNIANPSVLNNQFNQDQYILQRNHSNNSRTSLTYIEPFSDHTLLEIAYEFETTSIKSLRLVEDLLRKDQYNYIDSLSVDYDYWYTSHKGSMTYQYEPNKKFKMNFGFAIQPLVMSGYLALKDISYNYDNVNLIPSANVIYKFSKESDWQLNYRGKNNQPYFNQIAPVIDNTSSRYIIIGNPALKAEYAHRLSSTFRKSKSSRMQYFETNIAYSFVLNKIVSDKRTLENSIIQETTFKNTSGYYDVKWYYLYNTPFITEDIQLDLTGTTDYYNNLSFIDGRKRTTNQLLVNQSMQVKYTWSDYVETIINANYIWNQARYDIPYKTTIDIKTLLLGWGAKGYINDNFSIGLEMSQRFNDGYKNNILNVNQTLMNSFVEFSFLPNKAALLKLQCYDLFDQNKNSGIISEYIGNDVYEARNNRLGRYFMLSLNIRLQKLPKKD